MNMKRTLGALALWIFAAASANAGLVTLDSLHWPPTGSTGLENVQFKAATGVTNNANGEQTSVMVALGAHPYKAGATMLNNNLDTFYAPLGSWPSEDRANWSFDFSFDSGGCATCTVLLEMDADPSAADNWKSFGYQALVGIADDSWNMQMNFLETLMGQQFDSNANGKYDFRASMYNGNALVASTNISVITGDGPAPVPEPASLALVCLALLGAGMASKQYHRGTTTPPATA